MVTKKTKQKLKMKQEQKQALIEMQMKIEMENPKPDEKKPLGKTLSKGFYYVCAKHRETNILENLTYYKSVLEHVEFKTYYIKYKAEYKELKENFDGYASVIFIINNFCCLRCENQSRNLLWKIYYNKSLLKIAKVIIKGYVYPDRDVNSRITKRFYVGRHSSQIVKTQSNPTYLDNTIVLTGFGHQNDKMLVPYEKNIELSASHPIITIIESFSLEMKRLLEKKSIQEIAEMCINKIKGNSRFVIDIDYLVYGISGMFLHHISRMVAVILNHFEFGNNFAIRYGSEIDVRAISAFFSFHKIPHWIIEDGSLEHVKMLRIWLEKTDFSSFDNILICIMSHGSDANRVHTKNGDYDIIADIRDPLLRNPTCFNAKKFLYINKCRVHALDSPELVKITEERKKDSPELVKITEERKKDSPKITISYSTGLGYKSQRFPDVGSPYIIALLRQMKNSPFGLIEMRKVLEATSMEVCEKMDELDIHQRPEYIAPDGDDLVVDVSRIENLYTYGDEIIYSSDLSTHPVIKLKGKYDNNNVTGQKYGHQHYDERFSIIIKGKEGVLADTDFWKIQYCLLYIMENYDKRKCHVVPSYATEKTKNYIVIKCTNKTSMNLFIEQMKSCPIEGLQLTPATKKFYSFEIKRMESKTNHRKLKNPIKSLGRLKNCIDMENPKLKCHNWEWHLIEDGGKKVFVSLGLLDMERFEEAGKNIVLDGLTLKHRKLRSMVTEATTSKNVQMQEVDSDGEDIYTKKQLEKLKRK